jgi:hypothetical protein
MLDSHNDPRLSRWLQTEARGEEAAAEKAADAALSQLFAALPRTAVPAGFADRIMARVASGELAERAYWPLERAALWLLAVCAAALLLLPRWLPGLLDRLNPETWIDGLATLFVRAAHAVAALAQLWEGLASIARWIALVAGSPQVLAAVALCALLAATAGRLLLGLLDERSAGHAQVG